SRHHAGESDPPGELQPQPPPRRATEAAAGGRVEPGGRFPAPTLGDQVIDTYGCGDSFAAGVTAGLAAGWSVEQAISLGCHCGAACTASFGPYG
ncbi:MAG: PfkB family carbohydrate kinase, partial [Cyanobacteriota bacterium]